MKISYTYQPEFEGLEKYVDILEFSGFPLDRKKLNLKDEWLFHFRRDIKGNILHLLKPEQIKDGINSFEKYLADHKVRNPKIISLHLGFSAEDIGTIGEDNHNYAISEVYTEKEVFKKFSESLKILSEWSARFDISVAVENLDYHEGGAYEYVCKPEFIESLLSKNPKINFLLDIAHAEISAHKLYKKDKSDCVYHYIENLPLEKVIEIHLNSPDKRFCDTHLPAARREIDLIYHFKEKMPKLEVINLEYNSKNPESPKKIREIIPELKKILFPNI